MVFDGLATPNLTSIPPMSSMSRLSFLTAKLPEMTWSRSTMDPAMMFDHSELGKGGACPKLRIDDLVNFGSLANALRSVSVASRLSESFPPVRSPRTTQGKSLSSDLDFLDTPSFSPGVDARFDPARDSSAVSERPEGAALLAASTDLSCCSIILRYAPRASLSSSSESSGVEPVRKETMSLIVATLSIGFRPPFRYLSMHASQFFPTSDVDVELCVPSGVEGLASRSLGMKNRDFDVRYEIYKRETIKVPQFSETKGETIE
jgi:hypothetical protein